VLPVINVFHAQLELMVALLYLQQNVLMDISYQLVYALNVQQQL